jgi:hypothetical protein
LLRALETAGPILAYHAVFEKEVIGSLAERFSDLRDALLAVRDRFFDLETMIRDYYYHPDMMGSCSLKKVLPTIAPDLDYSRLEEVQNGDGAQGAYIAAIAASVMPERREQLRTRLLAYCELDTWAMVVLAWFLEGRGRPRKREPNIPQIAQDPIAENYKSDVYDRSATSSRPDA